MNNAFFALMILISTLLSKLTSRNEKIVLTLLVLTLITSPAYVALSIYFEIHPFASLLIILLWYFLDAKKYTKNILAVVNVEQSSIARESNWVFPTKAGPEIGVASTKAFICQLIVLKILNIKFASDLSKISAKHRSNLLNGLLELPRLYAEILSQNENIKQLCKKFIGSNSVLYLGRDVLYPIALEGALKLKEISYLHAEGYASGELKHGPIALIDKSMPLVALNPWSKVFEKTLSNLEEVKARRGRIILLTDKKGRELSKDLTKSIFQLPSCSDFLTPILYSLPLQLIAYYTALDKGTDVDQPRNLAKSVTVE